jgi:hypothetical protein
MSSGLPVNTFSQAAEYRKRYLASLALEAQNDAYNLQANQVYKRTGQVSQLPDTRSTTEKLADIERLRVDLRAGLKEISDPISIEQTLSELDNDEVVFVTQQLPAIIADLKPQFIKGVPSRALLRYIRDLRRKFLQTNGVSFAAQEATAQQILNAIQAGVNVMGANGGPFAIAGGGEPPMPPGGGPDSGTSFAEQRELERQAIYNAEAERARAERPDSGMSFADLFARRKQPPPVIMTPEEIAAQREEERRSFLIAEMKQAEEAARARADAEITRHAEEWLQSGKEPYSTLPKLVQDKINQIRSSKLSKETTETATPAQIAQFKSDEIMKEGARNFGPSSMEEWDSFPVPGGLSPYPDSEAMAVQFLKWWADSQDIEIQAEFDSGYKRRAKLSTLKKALLPGVTEKLSKTAPVATREPDVFVAPVETIAPVATAAPNVFVAPVKYKDSDTRTSSGVGDIFDELSKKRRKPNEPTGIRTSILLNEKIGNPKFSQKELVKEVTDLLRENDALERLVDDEGVVIAPNDINLRGAEGSMKIPFENTNLLQLIKEIRGTGIKPVPPSSKYRTLPIENRRVGNSPASRFPVGREILGYGLKLPQKPQKVKPIQLDMSKGLAYEASPTYIPFGKYAINPSKLSSGVFEMKTLKGGKVNKYPVRKLSPSLTKVMNRIVSGRGIDDYDFNEMDLEDQNFLYDLTNDAKINDRIHLPTPKRSKDGEEENRFEILKGQIISGNDNKELIKEFKKMLVKFSDDGRIKKAEAREILMDLAAMGY